MSDTSTALRRQLLTTAPQLTVEDAAHYLRTDTATVAHWLENGQLPGYRLPDRWLIAADELLVHLDNQQAVHHQRRIERHLR